MKRLLALLLLMILVAIPLRAEKYALLVGINGYQNNISPLRFCLSDVKALRQVLNRPRIRPLNLASTVLPPPLLWLWQTLPLFEKLTESRTVLLSVGVSSLLA